MDEQSRALTIVRLDDHYAYIKTVGPLNKIVIFELIHKLFQLVDQGLVAAVWSMKGVESLTPEALEAIRLLNDFKAETGVRVALIDVSSTLQPQLLADNEFSVITVPLPNQSPPERH